MKLDVLPCAIDSEAGIVFSLFLIFADFEPRCSYKKRVYPDLATMKIKQISNLAVYIKEEFESAKFDQLKLKEAEGVHGRNTVASCKG